jgi:glucose/arabinose dehydrogenase
MFSNGPPPLALALALAFALALLAPRPAAAQAAEAGEQAYAGGSSAGAPSAIAGLPPGFASSVFAAGLAAPMSMTFARDGRLLVCLKAGALVVVTPAGAVLPRPFLSLSPSLGQDSEGRMGDGGLFSATYDPFDAADAFIYVQWLHPGHNGPGLPWVGDFSRISRFTVDPADPNVALESSEAVVWDHSQLRPGTVFHFGGALRFGNDGKLLSAHGDYYFTYSMLLDNSLGKVSRIDKNGSIPTDGPFYASGTGKGRAAVVIGLRNPFELAVAPASLAGLPQATRAQMQVMDVGEGGAEEINDAAPGANLGWPAIEGYAASAAPLRAVDAGTYADPLLAYDHSAQAALGANLPAACCVTGGATCDSTVFPPAWLGAFFFTDLCGGWIAALPASGRGAPRPAPVLFARGLNTPQSIAFGPDGALYVIAHNDATVFRIAYAPLAAPAVSQQPASARVPLGAAATFAVSVASASPVSYQWQRAAPGSAVFANIAGGAGTAALFSMAPATLADDGARFRVSATTMHGYVMSAPATLSVMNNLPPEAFITSPPLVLQAGLAYSNATAGTYVAGGTVVFSARGVDHTSPQGPTPIPAGNISFNAYLRHLAHRHDFVINAPGPTLTLVTPLETEFSPHQAYEVDAFVTDANGVVAVATALIYPVLASLTIVTSPAGASVLVNSAERATPFELTTVAGLSVLLGPTTAGAGFFLGWSDLQPLNASEVLRTFAIPPGATTLTLIARAPSPSPAPAESPTATGTPAVAAAGGGEAASQFAGRSSSSTAPAQQQIGLLSAIARLAAAVLVAEVVRRLV